MTSRRRRTDTAPESAPVDAPAAETTGPSEVDQAAALVEPAAADRPAAIDQPAAVDHPAAEAQPDRSPVIPTTRTATTWVSLAVAMVLLVVMLVFILQNLETVRVSFFTVHWRIPLALDLLFAAVSGVLIALTTASLRILQLRRLARRHARRGAAHHTRRNDTK